jgi:hypothetical protein
VLKEVRGRKNFSLRCWPNDCGFFSVNFSSSRPAALSAAPWVQGSYSARRKREIRKKAGQERLAARLLGATPTGAPLIEPATHSQYDLGDRNRTPARLEPEGVRLDPTAGAEQAQARACGDPLVSGRAENPTGSSAAHAAASGQVAPSGRVPPGALSLARASSTGESPHASPRPAGSAKRIVVEPATGTVLEDPRRAAPRPDARSDEQSLQQPADRLGPERQRALRRIVEGLEPPERRFLRQLLDEPGQGPAAAPGAADCNECDAVTEGADPKQGDDPPVASRDSRVSLAVRPLGGTGFPAQNLAADAVPEGRPKDVTGSCRPHKRELSEAKPPEPAKRSSRRSPPAAKPPPGSPPSTAGGNAGGEDEGHVG